MFFKVLRMTSHSPQRVMMPLELRLVVLSSGVSRFFQSTSGSCYGQSRSCKCRKRYGLEWLTEQLENLEGNLYVGTSAAEILHFVLIPPEPSDALSKPIPILASRIQPPVTPSSSSAHSQSGIQQILLLAKVNKACILCNGTLTFYSLPELSPAFAHTAKVGNCNWVGGVDLDTEDEIGAKDDGVVIMILVKNKIRLVRVTEEVRVVKVRLSCQLIVALRLRLLNSSYLRFPPNSLMALKGYRISRINSFRPSFEFCLCSYSTLVCPS
jgi:hypothetical protein